MNWRPPAPPKPLKSLIFGDFPPCAHTNVQWEITPVSFWRVNLPQGTEATMHRWEALVRFDPEIREAAEKLLPYGIEWVSELGNAFFALNEDRSYLPNILEQLLQDAQRAHLHQEIADRERAFRERLVLFSRTATGEACSDKSMKILLAAEKAGYGLGRTTKGAFSATIGESTTFMYSNSDIERFGSILAGRGVKLD